MAENQALEIDRPTLASDEELSNGMEEGIEHDDD